MVRLSTNCAATSTNLRIRGGDCRGSTFNELRGNLHQSNKLLPHTHPQLLPSSVDGWWLYKQYCPVTPQDKRTWAFRRELFEARLLNDDKPDVIALQEASERSHEVNAPCGKLLRLFNPLTEILTASQHTLHRLTTRTFPFFTNGRSPTEVVCVA